MRILILNWRDIKNPNSGGAEILTHEMAKKWVRWGHTVTQISAKFKNSKNEENLDGVKIIRLGSWNTVHIQAFFYYIKNLRGSIDVIVDEVHGIPFFSSLYAPKKTVLLACEVADKLFFHVFSSPIAHVGIALEKLYFKLYKKTSVLAISESTKADLIRKGFPRKNIKVIPMGFTLKYKIRKYPKEKKPTLIYLSRINKQKGIEDVIKAFRIIKDKIPESHLWVVGSGQSFYVEHVKKKVIKGGLFKSVTFFGFVSDKKKLELLSRAHILIFPSIHEGWGLVIAEAGVMGTPSAVYKSSGVIDVIKNGERGIVSKKNNPQALSKAIINIFKNDKLYKELLIKIRSFENEAGWDKTANAALQVMKKYEDIKN